jgi:hypothetical protein
VAAQNKLNIHRSWASLPGAATVVSPAQQPSALLTEVHRPDTGQQLHAFALPDGN